MQKLKFITIRTKKQELGVKTPELGTQTRMDTGVWFPILFNIMSDSLYVTTGEAVRYNCQTARLWRLRVFPAKAGIMRLPGNQSGQSLSLSVHYNLISNSLSIFISSGVTWHVYANSCTPALWASCSASANCGCVFLFGVKYSARSICTTKRT